jgi:hypothetical protein
MPIHDWTRVDAGTFHDFHSSWITHLKEALNAGLLPSDYYAMSEQVASRRQTDVLTLQAGRAPSNPSSAGVAVAEAAPSVRLRAKPSNGKPTRRPIRRGRRLVVRHISGHRIVAVIEIVSPANKDRQQSVRDLAGKVAQLLEAEIHVLLIDLFPPGRFDPQGIHGAVWSHFDPSGYRVPQEEPLTLASYRWDGAEPEMFLEPTAVGRPLNTMPLFLHRERYINVPLEQTYLQTFQGFSPFWKEVLEADRPTT